MQVLNKFFERANAGGLNNLFNKVGGNGVNKRNKQGETKLYRAARAGSLKEVKKLLRDGADPNIPDDHGLTPLHQAAYWGEAEIVEVLLRAGADVNAENKGKGWTPLHSAAVSGGRHARGDVIDILLAAGANKDAKDKNGWTPGDYMTLWEKNEAAAEKLKQFTKIPNGLSAPRAPAPPKPN